MALHPGVTSWYLRLPFPPHCDGNSPFYQELTYSKSPCSYKASACMLMPHKYAHISLAYDEKRSRTAQFKRAMTVALQGKEKPGQTTAPSRPCNQARLSLHNTLP
ncbi:hypothetical protein PspLS_02601 [Pyricularia sp. CBS 133598]|nr:hypothetical protein PspLS_02601 [Pyricularia sp. CBS 133598]